MSLFISFQKSLSLFFSFDDIFFNVDFSKNFPQKKGRSFGEWMKSLGLSKDYSDIIKANAIDGKALKHMTNETLWNRIGITALGVLKILAELPK